MKKSIYLPSFILFMMVVSGCNKMEVLPMSAKNKETTSENTPVSAPSIIAPSSCEKTVSNFYAGQNMLAGTITVTNDAVNMYVTFHTDGAWVMQQTHLYVGPLSGLPAGANGNPKIGNFPYSAPHNPKLTDYTYTIPLSKFAPNACIVVAAHAEVVQLTSSGSYVNGQTAWGAGKQITPGGSWASYFDYCICHPATNGTGDGGSGSEDGSNG